MKAKRLRQQKLLRLYLGSIWTISAIITASIYLYPSSIDFIYQEDRLLENLSAGVCLGTFTLGICLIARSSNSPKNSKPNKIIALTSLLSLLGFLDEISYGERIFRSTFPRLLGIKLDGAHDFLEVLKRFAKLEIIQKTERHIVAGVAAAFILIIVTYLLYLILVHLEQPFVTLFSSFTILLAISQLIDLTPLPESIKVYSMVVEELFELFLAINLLFSCLIVDCEKQNCRNS